MTTPTASVKTKIKKRENEGIRVADFWTVNVSVFETNQNKKFPLPSLICLHFSLFLIKIFFPEQIVNFIIKDYRLNIMSLLLRTK
jgi:hypothetical protein